MPIIADARGQNRPAAAKIREELNRRLGLTARLLKGRREWINGLPEVKGPWMPSLKASR